VLPLLEEAIEADFDVEVSGVGFELPLSFTIESNCFLLVDLKKEKLIFFVTPNIHIVK